MAVKPTGHLWGWGLLITAVDLAHLIYWLVRGSTEWETAQAIEQERIRAWSTQSSEGGVPTVDPGASA